MGSMCSRITYFYLKKIKYGKFLAIWIEEIEFGREKIHINALPCKSRNDPNILN